MVEGLWAERAVIRCINFGPSIGSWPLLTQVHEFVYLLNAFWPSHTHKTFIEAVFKPLD